MLTHPALPIVVSRAKVHAPTLAGHQIERPRIQARLDRAPHVPLVVVTAPAGHGKTSSIATWISRRDIDAAWLTVDRRDADLTRFAAHVAVILDRLAPGVLDELIPLLSVPDRLPPFELGASFGEALYDLDRDAFLVIDDFHEASGGAAGSFVAGFLEAVPRRLHTILSSRTRPPFPLSRYRTMGDVEELTGADFRFSANEASEVLGQATGEAVDPAFAAEIQTAVGGWPAAIRLIAISRTSVAPARSPVLGAQDARVLSDYLGDEVLARLPAIHRDVLLRASLVDRFNAALLVHLSMMDGGDRLNLAALEQMRALELYREIPGLEETWFAYHPLFLSILRHELMRTTEPEAIAHLHCRVAHWFADAGNTTDAVRHFVQAGDIAAAAMLIEDRIDEAFGREDWRSVESWLRAIPTDEMRDRPNLLLASAWAGYLGGRQSRLADVLRAMGDPGLRARVSPSQNAEIALLADPAEEDGAADIAVAETAVALISPSKRYQYGYAHLALGMALTSAGREADAMERLSAFTNRESAIIDAAAIRGYFGRTVILWQGGRLAECERAAADQLQLASIHGFPVTAGWASVFLGAIAHERGDLASATRYLGAVIADADRVHFYCLREAFFIQILVYQSQGMLDEADRAMTRLRDLAAATESLHQLDFVDSYAARLALVRGDFGAARRGLNFPAAPPWQDDLKAFHHPLLTRATILVAGVGDRDALVEAARLLAALEHRARSTHMALALIEILAVRALLHEAEGDRAAATRALRESLALAAPEGITQRFAYLGPGIGPLLRRLPATPGYGLHASAVLSSLATMQSGPSPGSQIDSPEDEDPGPGSLSERELQVLRCVAQRLTNIEIGTELFISPVTVKHHVAHICEKFGVSGRWAAVDRARQLGLIA